MGPPEPNKKNRKTWPKGRVTGTAESDRDDLPNDPPDNPEGYNIDNPDPDKVFFWNSDGLADSRDKKEKQ